MTYRELLAVLTNTALHKPEVLDLPIQVYDPESAELHNICDTMPIDDTISDRVDICLETGEY